MLDPEPFEYPPAAVVQEGTQAIFKFLLAAVNKCLPVHRVKLMIVGYANQGKTTLLHALTRKWTAKSTIRDTYDGVSTDGIEISKYQFTYVKKKKQKVFFSMKFIQGNLKEKR